MRNASFDKIKVPGDEDSHTIGIQEFDDYKWDAIASILLRTTYDFLDNLMPKRDTFKSNLFKSLLFQPAHRSL